MCTHTDTEGKQSPEYFLKIGKNTIFNEHPVLKLTNPTFKTMLLFVYYAYKVWQQSQESPSKYDKTDKNNLVLINLSLGVRESIAENR